jgi:hypothetical protein
MIEIFGPSYRYQGEVLSQPEILVIRDHHYDETQRMFHVKELLNNGVCDPNHHAIVFDHVLRHDDELKDYNLIYFPSFLARENTEFLQQNIVPDWKEKTHIFNFMINKPRPHRKFLLELIRRFELDNFCHSLAWRSNPVNDIPVTDLKFGNEVVLDYGIKNGHFKNALTYQGLLQKTVFEPTCISLITEPVFYERETIITEKTLMAMYAGTIPIWVGGWCIPDYLKQAGFDTFDDIVDHSYQNLEDPADRCRMAVELNLNLLRNFDVIKQINWECCNRLKKNVELLETNYFRNKCLSIIDQYSGTVQHTLQQMLGR